MAGPTGNEGNHTINGLTVQGGFAIEGPPGQIVYLNEDNAGYTARKALMARSQGYYAETNERGSCGGTVIAVTGTVYYMAISLLAGDIVSGYRVMNTVAGSAYSGVGMKFGLYTPAGAAGTLIVASATGDVSSTAGLQGAAVGALATPYTVTVDGTYYVAKLEVATTPATTVRSAAALGGGVTANFSGGTAYSFGHQTAQTDLPASATLTSSSSSFSYWVGIA